MHALELQICGIAGLHMNIRLSQGCVHFYSTYWFGHRTHWCQGHCCACSQTGLMSFCLCEGYGRGCSGNSNGTRRVAWDSQVTSDTI